MDTISYHRAGQSDLQLLIDFRIAFSLELAGEQPAGSIDELKENFRNYFKKALNDNSCIAYIAKHNEEIAGTGFIVLREQPGNFKNPSGKMGYLMNMYTLPAFRRKGICTGLLAQLTAAASQSGITAFELHATKGGEYVYRQNGFKKHIEPTYRKYLK